MNRPDAELVKLALENQMSAFQQLVERHKRKVYYTAIGIVGNHHDAEDVMQEAILLALRSLSKLRQPEGFGPWLVRIAYNKSIDVIRKKKRTVSGENNDDENQSYFDTLEATNSESDPDRQVKSKEIKTEIKRILDILPESQRRAFLMKHVSKLSIKEIAEVTKSTESTVKTNIYRAVQKMRNELEDLVKVNPGSASAMSLGTIIK